MSRRWRGGVIGCGFFAPNQLSAWRDLAAHIEIVALCDLDRSKAQTLANAFSIPRIYTDAVEMLAAETLDFVDVVTTAPSHRQLVELAARHRVMTICQKPFAERLEDADAMVEACAAAGVPLLIHENFRWQRPFIEIAERLRRGDIGELKTVKLVFRHAFDIYSGQPYLAETNKLAVMDVGLHLFDLARFLAGDVVRIRCETFHLNPEVKGEDAFLAELIHAGGTATRIDCSFYAHEAEATDSFPQTLATIQGAKGSFDLELGYQLKVTTATSSEVLDVEPEVPAWGTRPWHNIQDSVYRLQSHAVDILSGRATPHPSGAHNRETLALVLAAYRSAQTGDFIDMRAQEVQS